MKFPLRYLLTLFTLCACEFGALAYLNWALTTRETPSLLMSALAVMTAYTLTGTAVIAIVCGLLYLVSRFMHPGE